MNLELPATAETMLGRAPGSIFDDAPMVDELVLFDNALLRAADDVNDSEAFKVLVGSLEKARSAGDIDQLYSMAMSLSSMACLHVHLEDLANQAGEGLWGDDNHDHERAGKSDKETGHDIQGCADCRAGRYCSRKTNT